MQKDVTSDGLGLKNSSGLSANFALLVFGVVVLWVTYLVMYMLKGLKIEGLLNALPTILQDLIGGFVFIVFPLLVLPTILAILTTYFVLKIDNDKEKLEKRRFGGYWKVSLTDNRFGNWLIKRRWFQLILEAPNTAFFIGVMIFGIYGYGGYIQAADAGIVNGATFLTWNIWWPGMILTFFFAGRVWCTMCPLGCVGEWAHRTQMPDQTTPAKLIGRLLLGFFFGVGGALTLGLTIGLFAGFSAETLMGVGQLSSGNILQSLIDYAIYLGLVPVNLLYQVFLTTFTGSGAFDLIFGLFWFASILFGLIVGGLFGYALPEFTRATVNASPFKQDRDPKRPYPAKLKSMWITTGLFAGIMMFDFVVGMFVNPLFTAAFIVILIVLSIVLGLFYERRAFCMYVCPLGGLIGTYGMAGTVEVRNKDIEVCKNCKGKYCLRGRTEPEVVGRDGTLVAPTWDSGYACPMGEFPMIMDRNLGCIMCTECFKSCPYDNITFNIRAPLVDTYNPKKRRFDQSGLAAVLVGLTLAVIMPSIPFVQHTLDQVIDLFTLILNDHFMANVVTTILWFIFAAFILPMGAFFALLKVSQQLGDLKSQSLMDLFKLFSFSIIPVGLSLHFSFWVVRIFEHTPTTLNVLADPFGGFFMGNAIYNSSGLILTDPVTFPAALLYLVNPLFLLGFHTMELGSLVTTEVSFAIRVFTILLGMAGSIYSANRAMILNLKHEEKNKLKILIPVVIWIILFTFFGLYSISNQV